MKKKLLIGAVAALFLGAGVFTATSLTQKEQISDLTLANIEAMTINLNDPDWQFPNGQISSTFACGNSGCTSMVVMCSGGGSGCNERRCSIHG